jgi:hypothetical protein
MHKVLYHTEMEHILYARYLIETLVLPYSRKYNGNTSCQCLTGQMRIGLFWVRTAPQVILWKYYTD